MAKSDILETQDGVDDSEEIFKILVVDDDVNFSLTIWEVFKKRNPDIKVDFVSNGNTAIKLWGKRRHQVVILDMMLPGRSGFLVLEGIRTECKETHVIMITANKGVRHERYAWDLSVDEYLQKSWDLPQSRWIDWLCHKVERVMREKFGIL